MGKRLASFLFGALATVLLAAPVQAQEAVKSVRKSALSQKLDPKRSALRAKVVDSRKAGDYNVARDGHSSKSFFEPQFLNKGKALPVTGFSARKVTPNPIRKTAARRAGETFDANGLIIAPAEGEHKFYQREGGAYFVSGGSVYLGDQSGYAEIVECEDGTVYLLDPISYLANGTWVKGTKSGNTITIPAGQPIGFNTQYMATLSLRWGVLSAAGQFSLGEGNDIVYNIEGDNLVLQGTKGYDQESDCPFIGIFWDDDDSFSGYGDYETVLTYLPGFTPPSTTLVQLPAGVETQAYTMNAQVYNGVDIATATHTVYVGFDGSDVYLQGLFSDFKSAWIKGTLENGIVTFPNLQYLGSWYDSNNESQNAWLMGLSFDEEDNYTIGDFYMAFNAEANTFTALNYALCNADPSQIYYLSWILGVEIGPWTEPVATTGAAVDKVPYMNGFGSDGQVAEFGIIDVNEDGSTWISSNGEMRCRYNSSNAADDWLISPAIYFEAGKEYAFSIDAAANSTSWPERMEVKLGSVAKASAMTQSVIAPTVIATTDFVTYESTIIVIKSGYYHIGIHGISDADMYYLRVDNFSVMAPLTAQSPRAPMVQVQPNPYGGSRAVVTVTAPELAMSGEALKGNLSQVVLYRDGAVAKVFENVAPGDILVFSDENVAGAHEYMALPFDADGNNGVKSEKVSVFIGLDEPSVPEITSVNANNGKVTVTWNPVTKGANGGEVGNVVYDIWSVYYEEFFGMLLPWMDEIIYSTTDNTATFSMDTESGEQRWDELAIMASNEAGESGDADEAYFEVCLGAPYTLPFEEHFATGGATQNVWTAEGTDLAYLDGSKDASDKDGAAIVIGAEGADQSASLILGKLTPGKGNPTLLFDLKNDGTARNLARVEVIGADGKAVQAAAIVPTAEYKTYSVSLADFQNEKSVMVKFTFDFNKAGEFVIDNVQALDALDYNLAASVDAPKALKAGQAADVNVKVFNKGKNAAKDFTVTLFAGDQVLLNEKVTSTLLPFATKEYNVKYESSIFDDSKEVTLRAEVDYAVDLDEDDNAAETVIAVSQSTATKPEKVAAEKVEEGVKLTWSAPSAVTDEVFEDFEDTSVFPAWSIGGITADNHYGTLGEWTLYDGDGVDVYGWNGVTYDNAFAAHAWQVFDPTAIGFSWNAPSGKQVLMSICPTSGLTNDWLISPELPGVAQTITFKAGQISPVDPSDDNFYGYETFEVLVSSVNKSIATFDKIGEGTITADGINEFSFNLPAGTKYFAIRHTSNDVFGLYIDDIKYVAGGGQIAKYNVYVDGKDGVYDDTTETSYVVKSADAAAAKWFAVSAVYDNGNESQPVTVTIDGANQEITAIEQIANGKHAVDIYGIDGKLIRQNATTLQGLKGTFIIEGKKVTIK